MIRCGGKGTCGWGIAPCAARPLWLPSVRYQASTWSDQKGRPYRPVARMGQSGHQPRTGLCDFSLFTASFAPLCLRESITVELNSRSKVTVKPCGMASTPGTQNDQRSAGVSFAIASLELVGRVDAGKPFRRKSDADGAAITADARATDEGGQRGRRPHSGFAGPAAPRSSAYAAP
jgi:hypothetical protein